MGNSEKELVDLLITYVDDSDESWRKQLTKYANSEAVNINRALNPRRYRSLGTLKYLLRGIAKFMPFVDRVNFIVSSESQVPKWINTENVRVILHRDFIPMELLPTFNSCTIESFFWKIPLHPYVLYANDDTYPIKPMEFSTFYASPQGEYVPNIQFRFYDEYPHDNIFRCQCRSGIDMTSKLLGIEYPQEKLFKPSHSINAWLRDSMIELGSKCEEELIQRATKFRVSSNVNQYIYAYWHYWNHTCAKIRFDFKYMTYETNCPTIIDEIQHQRHSMLCINDADHFKGDFSLMKRYILQSFSHLLGTPCKYEI